MYDEHRRKGETCRYDRPPKKWPAMMAVVRYGGKNENECSAATTEEEGSKRNRHMERGRSLKSTHIQKKGATHPSSRDCVCVCVCDRACVSVRSASDV